MKRLPFPFLLLLAAILIVVTACEKEEIQVEQQASTDLTAFDNLTLGDNITLRKPQIDALLERTYGYVESDYAKKYAQLNQVIYKQLNLDPKALEPSVAKDPSCLLNQLEQTGELGTGGGFLTNRGDVCETRDLVLTGIAFYVLTNGSTNPNPVNTEVLNIGIDRRVVNQVGGQTGFSQPLFVGLSGFVSLNSVDGLTSTTIIGRQLVRPQGYFCDRDDFGDGYRIRSIVEAINNTVGDGEIFYKITLAAGCKD